MLAGVDSGRGKLKLVSDSLPEVMAPLGRFYVRHDGWPMPSATTILKMVDQPWLREWQERKGAEEAQRIGDAARAIGNRFHVWAESYNHLGLASLVPQDAMTFNMANCYMRYADTWNIRPIGAECNLWSAQFLYAGTPDLVALADFHYLPPDTLSVIDYKTSGMPGQLWPLQLAAYAIMVEERGYRVGDHRALRLDKDKPGEMGIDPYPEPLKFPDPAQRDLERLEDKRAFLGLLRAWNRLHKRDLQKIANDIQRGRLVPQIRAEIESDEAA